MTQPTHPEKKTLMRILAPSYKLVLDHLEFELAAMGITMMRFDPTTTRLADLDRLAPLVQGVLCINLSPELAWWAGARGLPCVIWTIDPLPLSRIHLLPDTSVARLRLFAHDRRLVDLWRSRGWRAAFLPLAAHLPLRQPTGHVRDLGPTFAGSSLTSEVEGWNRILDEWRVSNITRSALDEAVSEGVELALGGLDAPPPHTDLQPGLNEELSWRFDGVVAAGLRRALVERMIPLGLTVWGDPGWSWCGKAWKGPLRHGQELTEHYARSEVVVDLPRWHQRDIATLRVFDAMACGACVMAAPAADLSLLFEPGRHYLEGYREQGLRDALDLDGSVRREVAMAGMEKVRSAHGLEQRARILVDALVEAAEGANPGSASA